jgi:hypothetical protein
VHVCFGAEAHDGEGLVGVLGRVDPLVGALLARERDGVEGGSQTGEAVGVEVFDAGDGEDEGVCLVVAEGNMRDRDSCIIKLRDYIIRLRL